jgi:hypothetical protein
MRPDSDDDDLLEEPLTDAMVGSAAGLGASVLAELLLDMTQATTKLAVLLAEADEEEFRLIRGRLMAYLALTQQLPSSPMRRATMGFKVNAKEKATKKSRKNK